MTEAAREAVLIVGAGSGIGRALVRRAAEDGHDVVVAGRDLDDLERVARDAEVRSGVRGTVLPFDAQAVDEHPDFVRAALDACDGELAGVVLCQGDMPEPDDARADFALAKRAIDVNYTASVSVLEAAAPALEARGRGFVCVVSSVAGDRGRPSNYLYGSTKAALSTFMQGMRARLAASGVSAVTVKPGFVDTGLTWGRPGMFLVAAPERVAADTWRAIARNRPVVYTPGFWALIMAIIRAIPTRIFDRLGL